MLEEQSGSIVEQNIIAGQKSAIRRVNALSTEEMLRMSSIEEDPERIRWFVSNPSMYTPLNKAQLREYVTNSKDHMVFAVSGSIGREDIEQLEEVGKMQGLVYVHSDVEERMVQLQEQQILPSFSSRSDAPRVLEISFAKLRQAPHGQMASGVREVCIELARMNAVMDEASTKPTLVISAYVMSDARGTNEPSIRVLEASGFEEKGRIQYDRDAMGKDKVFILNWEKLDRILKKHASSPAV